ncbi:MAG TPA: SLATT domain-containing protein [Terriglobia bacterium]|nr:SLATT domain-containing protein [Terriglobia bacterium]
MDASHADSWTPELDQLLSTWHRRMDACQHAYYLEAERYKRWHLWLGIPAVIFSTVVGTAVFATLESQVDISARVIVALVSIAAAVLAGLQTFLRLSEAAAAHAQAGDWYAAIKRDIEQLRALRRDERGSAKTCTDVLRKEMNKVSQKSPELRESLWTEVARRYGIHGQAGELPADR